MCWYRTWASLIAKKSLAKRLHCKSSPGNVRHFFLLFSLLVFPNEQQLLALGAFLGWISNTWEMGDLIVISVVSSIGGDVDNAVFSAKVSHIQCSSIQTEEREREREDRSNSDVQIDTWS
jgi:hypothetical protein